MKNKRLIWQIPFLLLLIFGSIYVIRQQQNTPYQRDEGFIFGTIYHITYQSDVNYQKEIEAELQKVDNSLSPFNKTSIISRINRNEDVKVDNMFAEVFQLAEKISKETDGAFDITVAPMVNAWGFGFKTGNPPTQQTVDSLRAIVGFQKVTLKEEHVKKQNPHIMLDFMVEIGGEIVVNGNSDKQVPWRVGINKPTDDSLNTNQELQDVINVTDIAMATSGNYRNFYYKNGKKYAHTIDPKTGYPVQHNILSATVLAKNCATADAYATSFMVMGLDGARKVLEKHPELDAYLIYSDEKGNNRIWYSPELKKKILK